MRLGYFTMPLHPLEREWHITLQEDREAIILADKLGFYDAFVGEHLADKMENVTNSAMFLASLMPVTENIKLGTGTSNISQMHPVLIASHAAMMDNLLKGRFIFGISPGALLTDAEALGNLDKDRFKIFEDAIDVILEIWTREPPYDIDLPGNQFKVDARDRRAGPGHRLPRQALPKTLSRNRWHRRGPLLQGGHQDGCAQLPPDVGKLPPKEVGRDPLAELCRGQGIGRRES